MVASQLSACLFDIVIANHKIASSKVADSTVLSDWPIQFDDKFNNALLDIEAHC